MTTSASRRENQRRAAIALLGFIALLAVLGVALWAWGPLRPESPISRVTEGEAAFAEASQKAAEVFGRADLVRTNPAQAERLLQGAWDDLKRAATAEVDPGAIAQLREQVADGLDELYGTVQVRSTQVYATPPGAEISAVVRGPDNAAYMIVGETVVRADEAGGGVATIARVGDGVGQGLAEPVLLALGGPDLLIVDGAGALWRWRPSDAQGSGTLGQVRVSGDQAWGEDVVDVATFVINPDQGLYRLYVPYPATGQILRYDPTADGSGFSPPTPYFVSEGEDVTAFRQLHIDGDVYAVTSANLLRYFNGRRTGFALQVAPDDGDIRSGHDYALMAASGTRGVGRVYLWDRLHQRICVFDKTDGAWAEQFVAAEGAPQLADVRGMYLVDRGEVQPPIVVWATPTGLFTTVLSADGEVLPTATPTVAPSLPVTTDQPGATSTPTETSSPTPEPTERPRRTPQTAPATP